MDAVKSVFIWSVALILCLLWLPLLAVRRLLDRDPANYYTGRLFRKLGKAFSRINPNWKITVTGNLSIDDRKPYVMVCNHQSLADIPLISNLPWEMKWVAKEQLFAVPITGWMMRLAGDIPVARRVSRQKDIVFEEATKYLNDNCSVIFFPEGTRSRSGKLRRFTQGAFELAIKERISVLPLVIEGTQNTLPKNSWKFGKAKNIRLKVLQPIETKGYEETEAIKLMHKVRSVIKDQLEEWRKDGRGQRADGKRETVKGQ